jgi:hypothetical protein
MSRLAIPVLLALVATVPSWAQSKSKAQKGEPAKVFGSQVAVDRNTGRLRQPTPEERQALAKALGKSMNRSTDGLRVKTHANGMQSVDLEGRFQNSSVAMVDADGKLQERCITNGAAVKALAKAPLKTKSVPEVK